MTNAKDKILSCKYDGEVLTLRRAVVSDKLSVFEWRNDETTRKFFFDSAPVNCDTHETWFDRVLSAEHVYLLIGELAGKPIGVLRYDVDGDCAEVSVYLVPGRSGQGLGSKLLTEGTAWIRCNVVGVHHLKARIVCENLASLRAFKKAGFRCEICEYSIDV
jgi:RimJ/RimL family protein N-acetyltransferase